ncbi:hypothetical protein [Streptomyces sp. NPDC006368]|uniref:hypothetical protein n=1 Tax=Streptomyces sp. NPDC006368 TaxID=3156760 RepID=UPI0033A4A9EF
MHFTSSLYAELPHARNRQPELEFVSLAAVVCGPPSPTMNGPHWTHEDALPFDQLVVQSIQNSSPGSLATSLA